MRLAFAPATVLLLSRQGLFRFSRRHHDFKHGVLRLRDNLCRFRIARLHSTLQIDWLIVIGADRLDLVWIDDLLLSAVVFDELSEPDTAFFLQLLGMLGSLNFYWWAAHWLDLGVLLCLGNWYDQLRVVFGFYDGSAGGSSGGRELLHVVVNLLVQGCSLQIVVLNLCCIDLLSEAVILR